METENKTDAQSNIYGKKFPLSEDHAKTRSYLVRNQQGEYTIKYNTILNLRRNKDESNVFPNTNFDGKSEIKFSFHKKEKLNSLTDTDFFLNFVGEIKSFKINHTEQPVNYVNHNLYINPNLLKDNEINTVTILFSSRYNHSGVGLHHYIDPSDNKEYLYTQFEPFDCNRVFPCFDQPDMKANLALTVVAPDEWIVLSNENVEKNLQVNSENLKEFNFTDEENEFLFKQNNLENKNYSLHIFNQTDKISSYLYALCVGPYVKITCPFEYEVPMNIYMRESMKNFGNTDEFFKVTIAGMEWYKEYFGIAYPFRKYDQIFCPEYNMGAMENVGLVTYNEVYCWKDTPTMRMKTSFAITVLHELAHMWFGNLVTMIWWDDLWLNESFATFISHLCLANAPEITDYAQMSWLLFNTYKGSAYRADQQSTTHPVMSEVKNTEIAETHFDEIVYEKGSSVLKQIYYLISDEQFSQGLKNYFNEYKWSNTSFNDFITKMSELEYCRNIKSNYNLDKDLKELCDLHLKKSGLNEVELKMDIDQNGKIQKFEIHQNPCLQAVQHYNRQTHLIEILFLENFENLNSEENQIFKNVIIQPLEVTNINSFIGKTAPKVVIINYNDWGYFKWVIDSRSKNNLKDNLTNVNDNLTKALVYRSLFDMVRDSKLSGFEYVEMVTKFLLAETSELMLPNLFNNLSSVITHYVPIRFYKEQTSRIFSIVLNMLKNQVKLFNENSPNASKDLILNLILRLITFSSSEEHYALFVSWLDNGASIDDVKINDDLINLNNKFSMVKKIFESRIISLEKKEELLEIQIKNDKNSDRSVLAKNYCYAVRPEKEIKEKLWNKFVNEPTSDSLYNMEALLSGFMPLSQMDLIEDYAKNKFLEVVVKVGKENDFLYFRSFVGSLSPSYFPEDGIINKLVCLVEETEDNDVVNKAIVDLVDDLRRKKKAYELCEEYLIKV